MQWVILWTMEMFLGALHFQLFTNILNYSFGIYVLTSHTMTKLHLIHITQKQSMNLFFCRSKVGFYDLLHHKFTKKWKWFYQKLCTLIIRIFRAWMSLSLTHLLRYNVTLNFNNASKYSLNANQCNLFSFLTGC